MSIEKKKPKKNTDESSAKNFVIEDFVSHLLLISKFKVKDLSFEEGPDGEDVFHLTLKQPLEEDKK